MGLKVELRPGVKQVAARVLEFWYNPVTQEASRTRLENEEGCAQIKGSVNRFSIAQQREFGRRHRSLEKLKARLEKLKKKDEDSDAVYDLTEKIEDEQMSYFFELIRDGYSDLEGFTTQAPRMEGSSDMVEVEVKTIDSMELFDTLPISLATAMVEGMMHVFPEISGTGDGKKEGPTEPPSAGG